MNQTKKEARPRFFRARLCDVGIDTVSQKCELLKKRSILTLAYLTLEKMIDICVGEKKKAQFFYDFACVLLAKLKGFGIKKIESDIKAIRKDKADGLCKKWELNVQRIREENEREEDNQIPV